MAGESRGVGRARSCPFHSVPLTRATCTVTFFRICCTRGAGAHPACTRPTILSLHVSGCAQEKNLRWHSCVSGADLPCSHGEWPRGLGQATDLVSI